MTRSSSIHASLSVLVVLLAVSNGLSHTPMPGHSNGIDSGRLFDSYGPLSLREESNRLDNLAAQLKKEPQSKGYVVIYEGSDGRVRDLKARACRAVRHLLFKRGLDSKQVVGMLISGGHREMFTVELWVWPREASDDLPRFQLGVSEKDVSVIKGTETTKRCQRHL
jgi:hypothetical protein